MTQWIELDGAVNVRDVGGLPTEDGGRIAEHRLIRADNLQDLSEADIDHLRAGLGVTDIVDLRANIERAIEGEGPLQRYDVTHHHLSLLPEDEGQDAVEVAEDAVLPWSPNADRTRPERSPDEIAIGPYFGYLLDRPDAVAEALRVVATSEGATVVHCAAGKDRTGTVVAMALDVAGVAPEVIAEEYALTSERIERVVERLGRRPAYAEAMQGTTLDQHVPQAETMVRLLDAIRERWGGSAGWLRTQGWSEDEIRGLRAALRAE
ncbi:tyrosine-protein phosphatase [Metallococcus carri]|uniref:tyrosine-protein phosphatase n=1 Tax=Metallococcus carri TaxID=1656884 RepID=UPI002E28E4D5|nr:tyrosine-protein phosphatase [Metallococcus carri]